MQNRKDLSDPTWAAGSENVLHDFQTRVRHLRQMPSIL